MRCAKLCGGSVAATVTDTPLKLFDFEMGSQAFPFLNWKRFPQAALPRSDRPRG